MRYAVHCHDCYMSSFFSYDKYGSLGRKESMGRYKKYQPSSSNSAVGLSMGSPRLVARNLQMRDFDGAAAAGSAAISNPDAGPSYANVMGPRQSPIMGRRALGPPQPSPKVHRRQTSNPVSNHHKPEVIYDLKRLILCMLTALLTLASL